MSDEDKKPKTNADFDDSVTFHKDRADMLQEYAARLDEANKVLRESMEIYIYNFENDGNCQCCGNNSAILSDIQAALIRADEIMKGVKNCAVKSSY